MAATRIPQNLTAPSPLHINETCPSKTMMPDAHTIIGLPLDITTYLTPADDAIYWAMDACCSPKPVHLAEGCYFWCEQPPSYRDLGPACTASATSPGEHPGDAQGGRAAAERRADDGGGGAAGCVSGECGYLVMIGVLLKVHGEH
ncbi:hypothetical protein PG984_005007 [Apiospora sp. TS-2023a]